MESPYSTACAPDISNRPRLHTIDHRIVWNILHLDLPPLLGAVEGLLREAGDLPQKG